MPSSPADSSLLQDEGRRQFLKSLLTWYKKDGRHDMPWRLTKDPYAIFVSEYMLQQTTVATVRPYYDRFLKRFPTLRSLADSDLNDVLALWSGLGYYARARNLWAAMRAIEAQHNGKIPFEQLTLMKLPGVGAYTSGAISSLAFNKPAIVLDGNIIRVLMRVMCLEEEPKLKAVQIVLRNTVLKITEQSLTMKTPMKGPKHTVLALMDLGATVCVPRNPKCDVCPLNAQCLARQFGKQDEIPMKEAKIDRPTVRKMHAIIVEEGKLLLGQRPKSGLFGGLWEFPGIDQPSGVEPVPFFEQALSEQLNSKIRVEEALPAFEHQLTHRVFFIRSFICRLARKGKLPKKGLKYEEFRWVAPKELTRLGISAITKRIVLLLRNSESPEPNKSY